SGIYHQLGLVAIADQIARKLILAWKQGEDQLGGGGLKVFPLRPAGIAKVDEESCHHRLAPLTRKEVDGLRLAFVQDLEVFLFEIGNEAPLIVGDGDRNDYLVYFYFDGCPAGFRLWLIGLRLLLGRRCGGRRSGGRSGRLNGLRCALLPETLDP